MTLAVRDLPATRSFYLDGLGWDTDFAGFLRAYENGAPATRRDSSDEQQLTSH